MHVGEGGAGARRSRGRRMEEEEGGGASSTAILVVILVLLSTWQMLPELRQPRSVCLGMQKAVSDSSGDHCG